MKTQLELLQSVPYETRVTTKNIVKERDQSEKSHFISEMSEKIELSISQFERM